MSIPITEYRNARAFNESASSIDVEINHPEYGWIPYLLTDYDTDNTINNDDLRALIGDDYAPYIPPTQEELDQQAAAYFRQVRSEYLQHLVDPIVSNPLRWGSLTDEEQLEVTIFRQNLLDISTQSGWPQNVEWPPKPECLPNHPINEEFL
jgi:hypothetical protein